MPNERGGVVLITGGSGLVGGAAALRLGSRYKVVAFDRPGPPEPPQGVETVGVDLGSDASVRDGLRQVRERHGSALTSVVHLGAYYDFSGDTSPLYESINVEGTARLLDGLGDFEVGQFVFASTMIVHAPGAPGRLLHEDSPTAPDWPYAVSKLRAERVVAGRRGTFPAVTFRIACVYDARCHHHLLAEQVRRVFEKRLTAQVFPGDPSHGQSFLHLDDLLDAFERAIELRAELPRDLTLLLGEPGVLSYAETQRALGLALHGRPWPTYRVPKPLAWLGAHAQAVTPWADPFIKPWMIRLADGHYALDVSRAREVLGWHPKHALAAELPRMAAALKADPASWYRDNGLGTPPA